MDTINVAVVVGAVVVAFVLWAGFVTALAVSTRSAPVRPGEATYDLSGEPPALVAFLTARFRAGETAAPATVLDLAARGVLSIEHIGPELSLIRLRRQSSRDGLNRYERLVYDRIVSLATADGVVATGALAEGTGHLNSWRKKFDNAVRDASRDAGLSEARWHRIHHVILAAAAVLPAFASGIAWVVLMPVSEGEDADPIGGFFASAAIVYAVLMFLSERLNTERGTPAGARAAGHWLGVRAQYKTLSFQDKSAASVTIWGRELAYASALGLADRAVVSLPIAVPADCGQAWSDFGGLWHLVQVRYRGDGPHGRVFWGRSPRDAAALALLTAVILLPVVVIVTALLSAFAGLPGNPVSLGFLLSALLAVGGLALAASDSASQRTINGQVVRLRRRTVKRSGDSVTYRYWVAIDDGTSRRINALGIDEAAWSSLTEGDVVEARAGHRLGWVYGIRVVQSSRFRDGTLA
ncbi:DUF2207 family protein [Hoyosella altamirensis]|uniref:Predicted membrane protein YciQ-like C-terminal domain-containing protein n=1 Tax=Hoyosella altamirensis TaxID=616997 RepID=A0A839RK35_9ACTN|nr:DUF2207 domain-containing protein [Hoyosella altamirensis]MBB3036767.1 hypothetical protein [Hoyosella altamirensis]